MGGVSQIFGAVRTFRLPWSASDPGVQPDTDQNSGQTSPQVGPAVLAEVSSGASAVEPQSDQGWGKFLTLSYYKGLYRRFRGLSESDQKEVRTETRKTMKALRDTGVSAEEKSRKADALAVTLGSKGILSTAEVDEIKNMTLDEKVAKLRKIAGAMKGAKTAVELRGFRKSAQVFIVTFKPAEKAQPAVVDAVFLVIDANEGKIKELRAVADSKLADRNITEAEANEVGKELVAMDEGVKMDQEVANDSTWQISDSVRLEIAENASGIQASAGHLIQIALEKGFRLDNFEQLAGIAMEGATVGVADITDRSQETLVNRIKLIFSNMTRDVLELLMRNREQNKKLDEESAEKVSQKNADERRYIQKLLDNIEELKQLVSQLKDKKLENMLQVRILALSYIAKNPDQISQALIDAINDDIQKIKWQIINNIEQAPVR